MSKNTGKRDIRRIRQTMKMRIVGRSIQECKFSLVESSISNLVREIEGQIQMGKGDVSGKEMFKVTMGFEHVTTIPKFKRRKVSAVRDFLPGCGRGATTNHGLNRQITVDQGSNNYGYLVLFE
ncbi:hypothetical protein J1N35_025531 [Gossypium stocksii]|uniref:Uncharacterized protein n=1 Tax=Gossypium stocksii TaxID=47602 RepID=A0A9D3ZYC8_9ROSI|nr:hypothetical protein J1N35_025531 [Gossypium stocksii]